MGFDRVVNIVANGLLTELSTKLLIKSFFYKLSTHFKIVNLQNDEYIKKTIPVAYRSNFSISDAD